jgi:hypothetical protein
MEKIKLIINILCVIALIFGIFMPPIFCVITSLFISILSLLVFLEEKSYSYLWIFAIWLFNVFLYLRIGEFI